jgi:queuine/archaeosine tRNA-ribosyltransferase
MRRLFEVGVDSCDSSTFVRQAISGRYLDPSKGGYGPVGEIKYLKDTCGCAVCSTFDCDYLCLEGAVNRMALALHNLHALLTLAGLPILSHAAA